MIWKNVFRFNIKFKTVSQRTSALIIKTLNCSPVSTACIYYKLSQRELPTVGIYNLLLRIVFLWFTLYLPAYDTIIKWHNTMIIKEWFYNHCVGTSEFFIIKEFWSAIVHVPLSRTTIIFIIWYLPATTFLCTEIAANAFMLSRRLNYWGWNYMQRWSGNIKYNLKGHWQIVESVFRRGIKVIPKPK